MLEPQLPTSSILLRAAFAAGATIVIDSGRHWHIAAAHARNQFVESEDALQCAGGSRWPVTERMGGRPESE
jgi:hypothetical protein